MCLNDLMKVLRERRPSVTVAQVRWAITTGKVSRPPLDGSLRFDFGEKNLEELIRYFGRGEPPVTAADPCRSVAREHGAAAKPTH